jgi:Domain of unknown function (DUF6458)
MGVPVSLLLIAVGAILAFAVNQDPDPAVDIDVVGWILMIVGLVGLLLSLLWWERLGPGAWGWHRGGYPPDGSSRRGYGRRRTVVEEDGPPPPPGPPAGPPPP